MRTPGTQDWQFSLTERQSSTLRDAMLRALYLRVVEAVIGHVNAALSFPESQSQNVIRLVESSGPVPVRYYSLFVGVIIAIVAVRFVVCDRGSRVGQRLGLANDELHQR